MFVFAYSLLYQKGEREGRIKRRSRSGRTNWKGEREKGALCSYRGGMWGSVVPFPWSSESSTRGRQRLLSSFSIRDVRWRIRTTGRPLQPVAEEETPNHLAFEQHHGRLKLLHDL
jgi:hypothetical protein